MLMLGLRTCAIVVAMLLTQPVVDHYARVLIGDNGKIVVITEDGRQIAPPADKDRLALRARRLLPIGNQ